VARRPRRKPRNKKLKATSLLGMCATIGFFLGLGLGALMNSVWLVTLLGLLVGGGIGFQIDRRNGVPYTRRGKMTR
jgi:divalent metal cation (Fe/Co/Zn/Cd) transporter